MKKSVMWATVALLSFILMGCGKCEHEYDDGVITKEPTCSEKGEKRSHVPCAGKSGRKV